MWEYTEKVKDHFLNPRNVGVIVDYDGIGEVGSLACGDALKLTFKLDQNHKINDAKFQTFGCASAIASSSALTEMIKGLSLEDAEKITNEDIADYLGGLPNEKMHCSVMGKDALHKAISHYRGEPEKQTEGRIVCECFGVTDLEIKQAVLENHLTTVEEVTNYTKAGGGCGNCHEKIQDIIDSISHTPSLVPIQPVIMTNLQKIRMIEETLEREIKPALKKDGGDIELVDVDKNTVYVKLKGNCASCSASQVTLKHYVETKLREFVKNDLVVEEVKS
ncbi:MAG: Fe-S cluster assembly protein NifU [Desulfobacteraceae bacterium]|nr:Fe-S cluster assembly protein NifU [Desulfobacteraceae bacterium]MBU4002824.1 Fe-S cluster assembly protein NifU [Pseudomonadota bacterium]MBU4054910.1 Fe-S cluster assembly protein NifU [Pseudomonadota bacterium]